MAIREVRDLYVYSEAFACAMELFEHSKTWPREERYALTDQVRRSSRSVCANLSEAWAKRAYPKHFASKVTDAHSEAEETLTWIRFAERCGYVARKDAEELATRYRQLNAGLVRMVATKQRWCTPSDRP